MIRVYLWVSSLVMVLWPLAFLWARYEEGARGVLGAVLVILLGRTGLL